MPWSIEIGRIAGTSVRIHVTFLLLLAWIGFSAWRTGGAEAAVQNLVFIVALFACVLAHEFGHIFMARRFGVATPDVTLLPIGGVANLERIPEKPSEELAVALAGPAVNVVIAAVLILILGANMPEDMTKIEDAQMGLLARLAAANVFLVLFNMLPAFPMDGGRVLRAVLSMRMDPQRATRIASRIGQGFAFLLGFLGLFGNPLLIFIAIFVYLAAAGESQESAFKAATAGMSARQAMELRVASVPVTATLAEAVDILLATGQHEFPVVDAFRKPVGLLIREDLIGALRKSPRDASVAEVMRVPAPTVMSEVSLDTALGAMRAANIPALSVVDSEGALVGLLTKENIAEMMLIKTVQPDWSFGRR
jgi:Zn-dependent protease/CBS domain-containing protein